MRRSVFSRVFTGFFSFLNRFIDWHRLPRPLDRFRRRPGGDVGIAVAIAADPGMELYAGG